MCKSNNCVVHWDALSPKTWPNKAKPKTTWFNLMEKPTWNCEVRFLWSDPLWQLRWWLATNCKQQPYTPDVHLMLQYVPHGLMDANNLDLHLQTQTHKNKQTTNQTKPNKTKQTNKTSKQNKQTKKQTRKQKQHTRIHIHTHTHCSPSKRLTLVFENAVMTMTIAPFSYHTKEWMSSVVPASLDPLAPTLCFQFETKLNHT